VRVLPFALLAFLAAALALPSPFALWALRPVPDPHQAYLDARMLASAARVVAAILFLAGAVALAFAVRRGEAALPRALPVLALASLALGGALLSPWGSSLATDSIHERYERGGFLKPYPDVDLARGPLPNETYFAFTGSREVSNVTAPIDVGPVHARRGDVWDVGTRGDGAGWPGDGRPAISSDLPLRCVPGPFLDERSDARSPLVVSWWRCVALASGDARVQVSLPGPAPGTVVVLVNVLPSLDAAVATTLARSEALLALGVAAAAGAGAWAVKRRESRPR